MMKNAELIPKSIDDKPCPFHFAAFFSSLPSHPNPYWMSVTEPMHLQAGDFIVYLPLGFTPKHVEEIQKTRTGTHIMIVEETISLKVGSIDLKVIDCTRFPHCTADTRDAGGIGRSPVTIHIECEKTILQWGTRKKRWEKQLFFGRLKSNF